MRLREGGGTFQGCLLFRVSPLSQEWPLWPCMLPSQEVTSSWGVFAKTVTELRMSELQGPVQICELLPTEQALCLHHPYISGITHSIRHTEPP